MLIGKRGTISLQWVTAQEDYRVKAYAVGRGNYQNGFLAVIVGDLEITTIILVALGIFWLYL